MGAVEALAGAPPFAEFTEHASIMLGANADAALEVARDAVGALGELARPAREAWTHVAQILDTSPTDAARMDLVPEAFELIAQARADLMSQLVTRTLEVEADLELAASLLGALRLIDLAQLRLMLELGGAGPDWERLLRSDLAARDQPGAQRSVTDWVRACGYGRPSPPVIDLRYDDAGLLADVVEERLGRRPATRDGAE